MNLSLSKQPWYLQLGAFCALSLAAVAAFYFLYASPARAELASKAQKLQALQGDIEKGRATEKKLKQFNLEVKNLETRFETLKAIVPDEKDVAELLFKMQNLAMHTNVKITDFKPRPVVAQALYSEVPFDVAFSTTYNNLGNFLDQLGKLPRIINVKDIALDAKPSPDANSSLTGKCIALTYVLTAPTNDAAPPPAKGAKKTAKPGAPGKGSPAKTIVEKTTKQATK